MIRAALYLTAAAFVWFAEGFLFGWYLDFSLLQWSVLAVFYTALFAIAVRWLVRALRSQAVTGGEFPSWRLLSLAPMVTAVVGSFVSLPVVLAVLVLGKVL
jgi:hypothetical protein